MSFTTFITYPRFASACFTYMLFNTLAEHPSVIERTMIFWQLDTKRNEHIGFGNTSADGNGKLHLYFLPFLTVTIQGSMGLKSAIPDRSYSM